jgi:hypothetical protein
MADRPRYKEYAEHMTDRDQPATGELEAELGKFVRQDFSSRPRLQGNTNMAVGVGDLTPLVARVASVSIDETERVIKKLKNIRDVLRNERDRVHREVGNYVDGSQAMVKSLTLVAENLARQAGS